MKKVFLLRSAPYNYLVSGSDLYESFDLTAQKKYDPSILANSDDLFQAIVPADVYSADAVYSSLDKRSIQTAHFISEKSQALPLLLEVKYSMSDFISKERFYNNGVPNVTRARQAFIKALISDNLQETYSDVILRVEKLLKFLVNHQGKILVLFSHGFYLKIIEAYIRDRSIKKNPGKLKKYFNGSLETFKFCEGFEIEVNDTIRFISYIRNKESKNK